eukprot:TRINITY_DN7677_c0_g2_i1.p1 TRINITY_DN7677_c0_g2~~TRINITY_DN7677_c0_g2_i1.p1  ORF type:complete len:184 (+),score=45.87 TRINITY_DN7677_c0_g2_i1:444-995(+)
MKWTTKGVVLYTFLITLLHHHKESASATQEHLLAIPTLHQAALDGDADLLHRTIVAFEQDPARVAALVNQKDLLVGVTLLYAAAQHGHANVVGVLLDAGALADLPTQDGSTPLHAAAFHGHKDIVVQLLRANAPVNVHNDNGFSPLFAAVYSMHYDIAQLLRKHGGVLTTDEQSLLSTTHNDL